MKHYWYHQPESDFPPKSIREPGQYCGGPRVSVACTQLRDRSSYAQRKLVDAWCQALPSLNGVRTLWFHSRVPQRLFDAACAIPGLEGLYIKWSGVRSLAALEEAEGVQYLHIGSSAGIESIEPLGRMRQLRWLDVENFKKVSRLDPLSELTQLDGLTVEGSMWTTQGVETIAPLGALDQLRYLSLINLRSRDNTLRPLFRLKKLEVFRAARWWPADELQEMLRRNTRLNEA